MGFFTKNTTQFEEILEVPGHLCFDNSFTAFPNTWILTFLVSNFFISRGKQ